VVLVGQSPLECAQGESTFLGGDNPHRNSRAKSGFVESWNRGIMESRDASNSNISSVKAYWIVVHTTLLRLCTCKRKEVSLGQSNVQSGFSASMKSADSRAQPAERATLTMKNTVKF
jgi:hypothetical protein